MLTASVLAWSQTVVIDARGHMLGRLASVLAKQLLNGQQVVRPRLDQLPAHDTASATARCDTQHSFQDADCIETVGRQTASGQSLTRTVLHRSASAASALGKQVSWGVTASESLKAVYDGVPVRPPQVVVRAEDIVISGGLVRQKMKYDRFLRKRMNTNPSRGPYHYRAPSRILWRTIRG